MEDTLPRAWSTRSLRVRDAGPADAPALTRLYNSCGGLAAVDPTFSVVEEAEILGLVEQSAGAADGRFRLQCFGPEGGAEPIGYFHLTHREPRPDTAWISMFVLGAAHQGRGHGHEVATGLLERLGRLPWCERVWLKVYLGNVAALRHWVRAGFRHVVEVRPDAAPSVVLAHDLRPALPPAEPPVRRYDPDDAEDPMTEELRFDIAETFVALDEGGGARPLPVNETFWEDLSAGRLGAMSRLVSQFRFTGPWSTWEMHPSGEELVLLVEGDAELTLDRDGERTTVRLDRPGSYVLIPRGTWHTATAERSATMLFVTHGEGTQHRPR